MAVWIEERKCATEVGTPVVLTGLFLYLGFLCDFPEEFFRFFVEVLDATFTAELYFLAVFNDNDRLAHLTKFVTRNDAGGERVGLGISTKGGHADGSNDKSENGFHGIK